MNPSYYRARLVKSGPYVGVAVWFGLPFVDGEEIDRSPRLQTLVHTEETARAVLMMGTVAPVEVEGITLLNIEPVSESEYQRLVGQLTPTPRERIDLHNMPSIF